MENRYRAVQHLVAEQAAHNRLCLCARRSWLDPPQDRQPPEGRIRLAVLPPEGTAGGDAFTVGKGQPNVVIAARSNSRESLFGYTRNRKCNAV
jgi:hypothetical protein